MRVLIVAHGGASCGMGHVMRCIALAQGLCARGAQVVFASKFGRGRRAVGAAGFGCADWAEPEPDSGGGFVYGTPEEAAREARVLAGVVGRERPDLVVIDRYGVDVAYFDAVRAAGSPICYVSDGPYEGYPVDVLLNGTAGAYVTEYPDDGPRLLLGLGYAPLRREFWDVGARPVPASCSDVLVSTGGTDPLNMAGRLIEAARAVLPDARYHVLGGAQHPFAAELGALGDGVVLHDRAESVPDVMLACDAALCAAGTTLYELGCCTLPTAAFMYAENQRPQASWLSGAGMILPLGTEVGEADPAAVARFLGDGGLRASMAERFRGRVDGRGALRAADALIGMV